MSAWKLTLGVIACLSFVAAARADDEPSPADATSGPAATIATRPDAPTTVSVTKSGEKTEKSDGVINVGKVEKVIDRYPDGKVHIEREMGLDPKGNYINQGSYKMYDTDGQVIREGDFVEGKQQGKWIRRFQKDEGHLFSPSTDDDYAGPFTSEATFLDGQLHGMWTIKDAAGQKIVEWSFDKGIRSGPWTLWHSNGKKRIEAIYRNGVINGEVIEYDRDEKEVGRMTYSDGKHLVKVVGWYTLGQKQYEGYNLHADNLMDAQYDWWRSTVTTTPAPAAGPDAKQGTWISWYRNGNKETEAHYDHDIRIGKFQWWYENGQPQAEGSYENGKKIGAWITWHPNGQKESMGEYQSDQLVGRFSHWDSEGKLLEAKGDPRQFYSNQPQVQQPQPQQPQPVRTGSNGFGFRNR